MLDQRTLFGVRKRFVPAGADSVKLDQSSVRKDGSFNIRVARMMASTNSTVTQSGSTVFDVKVTTEGVTVLMLFE